MLSGGGLPRWVSWLAILVAVAVAAGFAVTHLPDTSKRPIAGAPSEPAQVVPTPSPTLPAKEVLDVASGAGSAWLLTGSELARVEGTHVVRSVPLGGDLLLPANSHPRLAVDLDADRVWIVVADAAPSELLEYRADSLQRVRRLVWPYLVHGAVAYRSHLYVVTDFGVADLAPARKLPKLIAGLSAASGPIALDPARHRIVVISVGYPTLVWTYRPGQLPIRTGVQLPLGGGTVAVAGGAIWVGGFTDQRAMLTRLDPVTLHPLRQGAVDSYGPGAVITGAGRSVFWVRPGNGTNLLTCVNARTGGVVQRWHVTDVEAVASDGDGALVATRRGVLRLTLSGCAG